MNKTIFLDRDGIINIDKAYVHKIKDFQFCEGIFQTLRYFRDLGYMLIVVTNQSGIGRGYYSESDFLSLTEWMVEEFKKENVEIKKVYHCPHLPDINCDCRKPNTKMFELAIEEFNVDTTKSWMIGDKLSDIQAGVNAHISNTIFVNNSTCKEAKYSVKSILDTISIIKT